MFCLVNDCVSPIGKKPPGCMMAKPLRHNQSFYYQFFKASTHQKGRTNTYALKMIPI